MMQTFKQILEEMYVCKRVKITIGHPSNNQHIIATIVGVEFGRGGMYEDNMGAIMLVLKDIDAFEADYSQSVKNMVKRGLYNRYRLRLDTEIAILREENLNELIG